MSHNHCVVWIDHVEARIFSFNREDIDSETLRPAHPPRHLRHKAGSIGSGKAETDERFLKDVAEVLDESRAIVIVGPGNAKLDLARYIQHHHPGMVEKLFGVDSLDHPTDREVVAYARKYFHAADRMHRR